MRILFDINRLVWGSSRAAPSGIDRVVLAYSRWLLDQGGELLPVAAFRGQLYPISPRRFRAIIETAAQVAEVSSGDDHRWLVLQEALADPASVGLRWSRSTQSWRDWPSVFRALFLSGSGIPLRPQSGDLYLNVAHAGLNHPRLLPRLTAAGAKVAVMVHDLIPLTHPEYCSPPAYARHAIRMSRILDSRALIIANSASTARDILAWANHSGAEAPMLVAAPLGLEDIFLSNGPSSGLDQPYFVCVGTIEARKNLPMLLSVWRRLFEKYGHRAPRLVLVGLRGWENEAVLDHLDRSQAAKLLVHEAGPLGDAQLVRLMDGARALLAPSFAEGFDLPVMEARALGTPVIASDIPVHQELAGDCRLIDPIDGPAWLCAIEEAIHAPVERRSLPTPTWAEHFEQVRDAISRYVA